MSRTDRRGPSARVTYRDRVAEFFKASPGRWIDGRQLEAIGGAYAWRTRVSECRVELGMVIENRLRKVQGLTVSEYCYVPPVVTPELRQPSLLSEGL